MLPTEVGEFLAPKRVDAPRSRLEWLGKIEEAGVRRRAEFSYQQFDVSRSSLL